MNDFQKLASLYNYFEYLNGEYQNNTIPEYFTGEAHNPHDIKGRLFEYMTSLYGVDGFPIVVSDEQYEKIDKKTFYHGYKDYDHGANFLVHHNYHRGQGVDGEGFYVATNKNQAYRYTKFDNLKNQAEWDMGKVLEVKYLGEKRALDLHLKKLALNVSQGKIITDDEATEEDVEKINSLYEFLRNVNSSDENKKRFLKMFWLNESILALYLGYDYIEVYDRNFDLAHLVLLSRNKVIVKESEKNRFCENSMHYKSGAYDYNNDFTETEQC